MHAPRVFSAKCTDTIVHYRGNRCGEIEGLVQERSNSIVLAMELRLSCTNPSKYDIDY